MTRMGRHVLPASEKALFVLNWLARRVRPGLKPYIPDFRRAFHHFCLHAGACSAVSLGYQIILNRNFDILTVNTKVTSERLSIGIANTTPVLQPS